MNVGAGNTMHGTVREVKVRGGTAVVKVQVGDNVFDFPVTRDVVEDMGLKVGDEVTTLIESVPANIHK